MKFFSTSILPVVMIFAAFGVRADQPSFWDLLTGNVGGQTTETLTYDIKNHEYKDAEGKVVFTPRDLDGIARGYWTLNPSLKWVKGKGYVNASTGNEVIGAQNLAAASAFFDALGDREGAEKLAGVAQQAGANLQDFKRLGFGYGARPATERTETPAASGNVLTDGIELFGKKYTLNDALELFGNILQPKPAAQ